MNAIDQQIMNMQKGDIVVISEGNGIQVTAERSSDGKWLRLFRSTKNTTNLISKKTFNGNWN